MGIAIGSGKIGFAYLVDGELMDWRLSIEASRSETRAALQAERWLKDYDVDVLILEDPEHSRKGHHALALHSAIAQVAPESDVEVILMPRTHAAPNKYVEASELAVEFPQIAAWLPDKRRLWEKEPRYIVLFEALSLVWAWWRSSGPKQEEKAIDW